MFGIWEVPAMVPTCIMHQRSSNVRENNIRKQSVIRDNNVFEIRRLH